MRFASLIPLMAVAAVPASGKTSDRVLARFERDRMESRHGIHARRAKRKMERQNRKKNRKHK
jgi:hypothetical protein